MLIRLLILIALLFFQPVHAGINNPGTGSGGSPPVTTTFGLAANRADVPEGISTITANTTCRREHFAHPDGALSAIQTVDVGWYLNGSSAGIPTTADSHVIKRYIEYPAGTFTQITWSAATSVTVGVGAAVKSDLVPISIPAGAEFWERTVNLTSTVTNYPTISLPFASTTIGVDDGCVASTDLGNSGTVSAGGTTGFLGAAAIMGTIQTANARSFFIIGDSIAFGQADQSSGAKGGSGYISRALDIHGYPYARMVVSGWSANSLVVNSTLPVAFIATLTFPEVIQQLGTNDMAVNSRSAAQILADHQTIYGMVTGKTIHQTTINSRTSSTDGFITTANQTVITIGTLSQLNSLNASIRALPTHVTDVLDAADGQMSARDSDIWSISTLNGVAKNLTSDGIHPNQAGSSQIATAVFGKLNVSGLSVNLIHEDSSVAAPQAFRFSVQSAADQFTTTFKNTSALINILVGYGDINGTPITIAGDSKSDAVYDLPTAPYTTLRASYLARAIAPSMVSFAAGLPNTSTYGGATNFFVPDAISKAFGYLPASGAAIDGHIGFATTGIPAGQLVGDALHEIHQAMGGQYGNAQPSTMSRYSGTPPSGTLDFSTGGAPFGTAYFSIDQGVTKLAAFGTTSDGGDFNNVSPTANDPFSEISSGSTIQTLTAIDIIKMNSMGIQ